MQTDPGQTLVPSFVCRWAAGLLLDPPGAAALERYRTPEGVAVLDALGADPALARSAATLSGLVAPQADLVASADRLAAAHAGAFLIGGRRAAPPYASVWLSPRGLVWQEPARAMAQLLDAAGLTVEQSVSEPPDHIGVQLNLLAELLDRVAAVQPVPISPQAFVHEHLLTWLPAFAHACDRLRQPFFYPELAHGLTAYLQHEVAGMIVPGQSAPHDRRLTGKDRDGRTHRSPAAGDMVTQAASGADRHTNPRE